MPYFRVDDNFGNHPKVLAIPRRDRAACVGLWTLAGAWCAKNLTDGHLGAHMVDELASSKKYADALVKVGLWDRADDGYVFHDWLAWQGWTREEVLAKRAADAERKRQWREQKAKQRRRTDAGVPDVSQRDNQRTDSGTGASVREESGRSPLLPIHYPSTTHTHVPSGDMEDGSPWGGNGTEADAHASDDHAPRCAAHSSLPLGAEPACRACQRLREDWEATRTERARPAPLPPLCGQCDDRWIDTNDGLAHCPRCHPAALALTGEHP